MIVDSYEGVPLDEEAKESIPSLVPDYIYGEEYQLVHIPTQSLVQFRELEDKIKTNCKVIEKCVKVLHFFIQMIIFSIKILV